MTRSLKAVTLAALLALGIGGSHYPHRRCERCAKPVPMLWLARKRVVRDHRW